MTATNRCPELSQLEALLVGKIEECKLAELEQHLDTCSFCTAQLVSVTPRDQLLDRLRQAGECGDTELELIQRIEHEIETLAVFGEATIPPTHATLQTHAICKQQELWPATIGKFTIVRELGRGGMGIVYEGFDEHLQRPVAIKVIAPHILGAEAATRFLREARAVASLRHRRIVTIHEVGEDGDFRFIAMERLDGESLEERLSHSERLSVNQVLEIAIGVTEALCVAHAKGILHRDIKPSNIWLEPSHDGEIETKLLDFGLCLSVDRDAQLTGVVTIVGTPCYMSPEQAMSMTLDERADLYSLGCVLYKMLCGETPFSGATFSEIVRSLAVETPCSIREKCPDAPQSLSDIVDLLLQREREQRIASASLLLTKLRAVKNELDVETKTILRKSTSIAFLLILGGFGLLLLMTIITIRIRNPDGKDETITISTANSPDSVTVSIVDPMTEAPNAANEIGATENKDIFSRPVASTNSTTTAEILSLDHLVTKTADLTGIDSKLREKIVAAIGFQPHKPWNYVGAIYSDVQNQCFWAVADTIGQVSAISMSNGEFLGSGDSPLPWAQYTFTSSGLSADGTRLLATDGYYAIDRNEGTFLPRRLQSLPHIITGAVFSPDGRWAIAMESPLSENNESQMKLFRIDEDRVEIVGNLNVDLKNPKLSTISALKLSTDGKTLYGYPRAQWEEGCTAIWHVTWDDGGPRLDGLRMEEGIYVEPEGQEIGIVVEPAISKGGGAKIFSLGTQPRTLMQTLDWNGGGPVCISSSGKFILLDLSLYKRQSNDWKLISNLRDVEPHHIVCGTFSNDEKLLAIASLQGAVRLFNLNTDTLVELNPPSSDSRNVRISLSSDGRWLGTSGCDGCALYDLSQSTPTVAYENDRLFARWTINVKESLAMASSEWGHAVVRLESGQWKPIPVQETKDTIVGLDPTERKVWLSTTSKLSTLFSRSWSITPRGMFIFGDIVDQYELPLTDPSPIDGLCVPAATRSIQSESSTTIVFNKTTGHADLQVAGKVFGDLSRDQQLAVFFPNGDVPVVTDFLETPPRKYPISSLQTGRGIFDASGKRILASRGAMLVKCDWLNNTITEEYQLPVVQQLLLHPDNKHALTVNGNGSIFVLRMFDE